MRSRRDPHPSCIYAGNRLLNRWGQAVDSRPPAVHFAGTLGRVKGPLATLAAGAPLTRPARSRKSASTGATTWCVRTSWLRPWATRIPRPIECASGPGVLEWRQQKATNLGHDFDQRSEVARAVSRDERFPICLSTFVPDKALTERKDLVFWQRRAATTKCGGGRSPACSIERPSTAAIATSVQDELFPESRSRQAIQEAFGRVVHQRQCEVLATLLGHLQQSCPYRCSDIDRSFPRHHDIASQYGRITRVIRSRSA